MPSDYVNNLGPIHDRTEQRDNFNVRIKIYLAIMFTDSFFVHRTTGAWADPGGGASDTPVFEKKNLLQILMSKG